MSAPGGVWFNVVQEFQENKGEKITILKYTSQWRVISSAANDIP